MRDLPCGPGDPTRSRCLACQEQPLKLTRTARALVPGAFVALLASVLVWRLPEQLEAITDRYALLLYALGVALAAFFHRSRVVVALVALAALHFGVGPARAGAQSLPPLGTTLLALFGMLALVRDRGVLSRGGLIQAGLGAALGGAAYWTFLDPAAVAFFAEVEPLSAAVPAVADLPQMTLLVGSVSLLAGLYGAARWRGAVERALVWAQLLVLGALVPALAPPQSGTLLMAAGLVLSLSVLAQSYSMAYRDELTGLPARRALVLDLADVEGGTYTVAMVDVDHFKRFNDEHGHDVGDQVLQLVASKLGAGPGGGKAYRYGGEEFTLLYPGRVAEDAHPHAEAVRASVEGASFSLRAWNRPRKKPAKKPAKKPTKKKRVRKLSVTVSVGLADSSEKGSTAEDVLKRADEALYRAKRGGRNRVAT